MAHDIDHASRHETGGDDELTPAGIGASDVGHSHGGIAGTSKTFVSWMEVARWH